VLAKKAFLNALLKLNIKMFSLHATGIARLIFHPDQSFEGVLITEDTDETFGLVGNLNQTLSTNENETKRLVDINVTDGETGQSYIVRRVDLIKSIPEDKEIDKHHSDQPKSIENGDLAVDAGVSHHGHGGSSHAPTYELHSEVLNFTTDEILIGNRADRDITTFLNPDLIGKQLRLYLGKMSIHFTTAVTSPATPSMEQMHIHGKGHRLHHVSICGANTDQVINAQNKDSGEEPEMTDADINFLM